MNETREAYEQAARAILAAPMVKSALERRPRTPPVYLRHKNHWSGWSISFRRPNAGDGPDVGPLVWDLRHADGPVVEATSRQPALIFRDVLHGVTSTTPGAATLMIEGKPRRRARTPKVRHS